MYLISDDILDSVSKTRYSFLDNEITEVEPSDYDKAVIELSGTVRPQTITLEIDTVESEEETESGEDEAVVSSTEKQYTLTTPTVQTITEASASQVTDGLYSLYANQIAAANPTEEQLAEYGLDEPYSVVSVSIDGVEQFTLRASERNSNNYVYMTKDGSPFVYLVSASRLSWLTVQVEQLTQSVYEPVELDELSSLTVESADQRVMWEMVSARASSPPLEPPCLTMSPTPTPTKMPPKIAAANGLSDKSGSIYGNCSQIL